nr:pre-mRNA-splicing factor ATP-dependent RNA helicase PRP16 [Tanacetum cinerariifolium]
MDINKMTDALEPEETGVGGLQLQGKDLVVFRPSERKSLFVKDSYEDVEKSSLTDQDDVGSGVSSGGQNKSRKYRDSSGSKTFDSANIKSLEKNDLLDMLLPRMLSPKISGMLPPNRFQEAEKVSIDVIFPKKGGIPPVNLLS